MNLYLAHAWAASPERIAIAAAVTLGFAALARALRGVNRSGAVGGGVSCFLLFAGAGPAAFAALAALFVMTWLSTHLGHGRKLALGIAERREGRNAWQVLANLAVATFCAATFSATGNRAWLIAALAALSEAATDTVASEIGQSLGPEPRLITTWQRVATGTDGGTTIVGSFAGLVAGIVVTGVGAAGGMIPWSKVWIPVAAGFTGMLIDGLLGATLQRRGRISNQGVNFVSTIAAAVVALSVSILA